jgi:hypothetical protein
MTAAVEVGFDVNVHDAIGLRVRKSAWFGGGNGSYLPLTPVW